MLAVLDINMFFTVIVVTLLIAPYVVAKLAYYVSRTMPEKKLDVRQIIRSWAAWLVTVIAGLSLLVLQWHEFSLFSATLYVLIGMAVAIVSICVLIVAATGPA